MNQNWCIVGGGMLGLAAASYLKDRGAQVTLLESATEVGGLASAWQVGDVTWDRYYHVTLLSDSSLRELLDRIGLEREIQWVQTRTGFFTDGRLHSLSSSLDFLRFPPLSLISKFRLGGTIFYASKLRDWRRLESIPVETWLRKLSGRRVFEKIWLPLLKAKLGDAYRRTSAAFIWAYIDRMYKARRSGMKREMFGYVPGGYCRILKDLSGYLTRQGVQIRTSTRVERVERDAASGRVRVTMDQDGRKEPTEFDHVLVTTPTHTTARICPDLTDGEQKRLTDIEYLGVICTSVLLDQPLGGYYVTNITDAGYPVTGIIEMGSLVPPEQLNGRYLVYLPRYVLAGDPDWELTDEAIHERCMKMLESMYPHFKREQVSAMRTARTKQVMAIPTLDYSQHLPETITSIPGVYVVTSAQIVKGTLNVNESMEHVRMQLEKVILPHIDKANGIAKSDS
ncbi:MAG: NAD(P)/FAD-dependent oxidoreductase [Pirellulales bacterium]